MRQLAQHLRPALCAAVAACLFAWSAIAPTQADASNKKTGIAPPQILIDAGLLSNSGDVDTKRAGMSWAEVLAEIEPAPWPEVQDVKPAGALPHDAVTLLEQSDEAMHNGQAFRAVQLLQEAQVLAPDHPKLVRALGLAYAESGNLARAAHLLRPIAAADRNDVEVLLLLARHAAERGQLENALAYAEALQRASTPVVGDYHLATALSDSKYTAAAAERLSMVLDAIDALDTDKLSEEGNLPPLLSRELRTIQQTKPQLHITLGDWLLQSGKDQRAAEVYASVELQDAPGRHALIARRMYLALRANDRASAIDQVMALLSRPDADDADVQLLVYLLDQGVPTATLAARLEALLQTNGSTLTRLLALAKVADKDRLLKPINDWLSADPVTPDRLTQAVSLLAFDDAKPEDAKALADLLKLVTNLMQQSPGQASSYAHAAIASIDAPVTLLRAIRSEAFTLKPSDYDRLLSAVAYEQTGRSRDALDAYQSLLTSGKGLPQQVLLPAVRLHLALNQGKQAQELLGEPGPDTPEQEFDLAVRAMAAAGNPHAAIDLVDERIKTQGKQLHLDVLRIELIAQMGQPQQACNLLLRIISSNPSDVALYRLGIDISFNQRTEFNSIADADRMRRAFLTRLISNLPDEPLSRISMAQNILSNPARLDEAEQLLLNVLQDEPGNEDALSLLVGIYDQRGDEATARVMFDRYTKAIGPGVRRTLIEAERATQLEQPEQTANVIGELFTLEKQGVLPGPPLTGDQAASLLQYLDIADPKQDTDALYIAMLRRFPDHATLNNALGYRWAVQGKNLRQAQAMITRALKDNPTSHSVLDSLAWVQYKLGEFEEAKATQGRALLVLEALLARVREVQFGWPEDITAEFAATTAILNDHMGDILYRLGQPREARSHWRVASEQQYTEQQMRMDPELRSLQARLKAKIDAVGKDQPAPIAPVPGPEAHGPKGHPADQPPQDE